MKTLTTIIAATLAFTFIGYIGVASAADKTDICHVPAGNPDNAHSISVSDSALPAHLGDNEVGLHGGDTYGECAVSELDPCDQESNLESCAQDGIYF
jgi:hypothetical protein